jgi:hypothetical protein
MSVTKAPYVRREKKLKLSSDDGYCGNKKCKETVVVSGGVGICRGFWNQVVGFVLVRLVLIWLQSPLRYFHACLRERNCINFVF